MKTNLFWKKTQGIFHGIPAKAARQQRKNDYILSNGVESSVTVSDSGKRNYGRKD